MGPEPTNGHVFRVVFCGRWIVEIIFKIIKYALKNKHHGDFLLENT